MAFGQVAMRPPQIPQQQTLGAAPQPQILAPQLPPPQQMNLGAAPPTGLIGSEQAIRGGLQGSLTALGQGIGGAQGEIDIALAQGRQDLTGGQTQATGLIGQGIEQATGSINQATGQAIDPLTGFTQQGQQSSQLQAAQSGALGPEAQAQAFQNFQSSPGQQFLVDEAERAVTRNAAATGGLGGGNVLRELQRQAIGLAQQDFGNQFNRLGEVSNRGFQGAGLQSGIQERAGQNLANIQSQGGQNLANIQTQGGQNLATLGASAGQNLANLGLQSGISGANLIGGAAQDVAQQRFGTGQQIAQAAGGTTASLANLQNQLGGQFAGVTGQGTANLANLVSGTGQAQSQLTQNLSTMLANIGTGAATGAAQSTNLAGQFDAAGILGQNTAVQNTIGQLLQQFGGSFGGGSNTSGASIQSQIDVGL